MRLAPDNAGNRGHIALPFDSASGINADLCRLTHCDTGGGKFENFTAQAGIALPERICITAAFGDIDNDGDPDLEPALELKRHRLEQLRKSRPQDEERLRLLQEPETWALATPPELRTLFVALVDRVVVDRAEVRQVLLRC